MKLEFKVGREDEGRSVKYILKHRLELSGSLIKKLKYSGGVLVNSTPARVVQVLRQGDTVCADLSADGRATGIIPQEINIEVVFEDEWIIALNKGTGIVVHPTSTHPDGTVANALMHYFLKKGEKNVIRPLSRLDRDTSGLIMFAKNSYVQEALSRQMARGEFRKSYIGMVHGRVVQNSGTINMPIARRTDSIILRQVSESGAPAMTRFEVLERFRDSSLLRFELETGRTHQIRVHCQASGHALIGDTLYPPLSHQPACGLCAVIKRQALHSVETGFIHPYYKTRVSLFSPLPPDMAILLEILKK